MGCASSRFVRFKKNKIGRLNFWNKIPSKSRSNFFSVPKIVFLQYLICRSPATAPICPVQIESSAKIVLMEILKLQTGSSANTQGNFTLDAVTFRAGLLISGRAESNVICAGPPKQFASYVAGNMKSSSSLAFQ
jgi:hypothetical protein